VRLKVSPNLGCPLGSKATRNSVIGEPGNFLVSFLHDGATQDGQVSVDDAAANGLSLALTGTTLAVARVSLGQEKPHPSGCEDTLLHGEALFVVASGDAEDVALPLVSESGSVHLHTHAFLIKGANLNDKIMSLGPFGLSLSR
jgi:hypothetical protein